MEALGTASACLELFKTAIGIISYVKAVKDSSEAASLLVKEVSQTKDDLLWVETQREAMQSDNPAYPHFAKLLNPKGKGEWDYGPLLLAVNEVFADLVKKLHMKDVDAKQDTWRAYVDKFKRGGRALMWPLIEKDILSNAETLSRINQQISKIIQQVDYELSQQILENTTATRLAVEANHSLAREQLDVGHTTSDDVVELKYLTKEQIRVIRQTGKDVSGLKTTMQGLASDMDNIRRDRSEEQFVQVLNWISPLEVYDPLAQIPDDEHIPGDWLFKDAVMQAWESGRPWRLMLYGNPGHGKTMLASLVARHLRGELPSDNSQRVFSIFLKYEEQETQGIDKLFAFLLKQSLAQSPDGKIPPDIAAVWKQSNRDKSRLTTAQALQWLKRELQRLQRSYIIIDGLDEASTDNQRTILDQLEQIKDEISQEGRLLSLLYTSRPLDKPSDMIVFCNKCDVGCQNPLRMFFQCRIHADHGKDYHLCQNCAKQQNECDLYEPYDSLDFDLTPPDQVIISYIHKLLHKAMVIGTAGRSGNFDGIGQITNHSGVGTTPIGRALGRLKDPDLEQRIVDDIARPAAGSFFFAKAHWDNVKNAARRSEIEEALASPPPSFNATYESALERIQMNQSPRDAAKGMKVIMWLSYSKRVLKYADLRHAITVETKHYLNPPRNVDGKRLDKMVFDGDLQDMESFFSATAGLVHASETGGVRLMHRTAYDFFQEEAVRKKWFKDEGHREIAITCMAYLSHTEARNPCVGVDEEAQLTQRYKDFPFAWYASRYWGDHASAAQNDEDVSRLAFDFLKDQSLLSAAVKLSNFSEDDYSKGWDVRQGVSLVHVAAWFGLESVISKYVHTSNDVNIRDSSGHGRTPLIYACRGGQVNTIKLLTKLGADINKPDDQLTPIRHAVKLENSKAVRALCENRDLDINHVGPDGLTSLMAAAMLPSGEIIEALGTASRIDVNFSNSNGFTALIFSVMCDSVEGVRAILGMNNVNINHQDAYKNTALHWASSRGKHEAVHQLLQKGADKSIRDTRGATALMLAVYGGFKNVVEEFDHHEAVDTNADIRSSDGCTLMHAACDAGEIEIVRWLIERGANINANDQHSRTPLHLASREGRNEIVKILLGGGVDKMARDCDGKTAAELAFSQGFVETANLIDPPKPGEPPSFDYNKLSTPVLARRGFDTALGQRLSNSTESLFDKDEEFNTALHFAVFEGHNECVRLILEAGKGMDVGSAVNKTGESPVHFACLQQDSELVQLLVAHEPKPNLELINMSGETALIKSVNVADYTSATVLVGADADLNGFAALPPEILTQAIHSQNKNAVKRLIKSGMENTYLDRRLAKDIGNEDIKRLLLRHRTFGKGVRSNTALSAMLSIESDEIQESGTERGCMAGDELVSSPVDANSQSMLGEDQSVTGLANEFQLSQLAVSQHPPSLGASIRTSRPQFRHREEDERREDDRRDL